MTTAHRPTFDPAKGKEALRGPAYHQRLLPAHTQLKYRQPGQGGSADATADPASHTRDLAAELLAAEAAYFAKKRGHTLPDGNGEDENEDESSHSQAPHKRIKTSSGLGSPSSEDPEAKRRRILEDSRDMDADSSDAESSSAASDSSSEEDSDSEEDEQEELMRELERVKREKALKREKEEAERRRAEEDARERDIAMGNPLLNSKPADFTVKRRWDDDVVFKNQARDADDKRPKEFVNDMLRSDFHKRFMGKYVR